MRQRPHPGDPTRDIVLILQPYVPAYRVAFFDALDERLARAGLRLIVLAGHPRGGQAARQDVAQPRPWLQHAEVRRPLRWAPRLHYRVLPSDLLHRSRVVVAELSLMSLDAWRLGFSRRSAWPLLYWGHVGDYVTKGSVFTRAARAALMRLGDGVLAYTEGGAQRAVAAGISRGRVFVVQNSAEVPVSPLTPKAVDSARFAFIGGLDESKRLDMLLDVGDILAQRRHDFSLLVAGDGEQRPLLEEAARTRGYLKPLGRADEEEKLRLASQCVAMLMPGRVGLVVIDSFRLHLPIVTTRWRFHAPEFEYLSHGYNALIVEDDPYAVADAALSLLDDSDLLERLVEGCQQSAEVFTLGAMVANFARALIQVCGAADEVQDDI